MASVLPFRFQVGVLIVFAFIGREHFHGGGRLLCPYLCHECNLQLRGGVQYKKIYVNIWIDYARSGLMKRSKPTLVLNWTNSSNSNT
jgi:hypothetical protein